MFARALRKQFQNLSKVKINQQKGNQFSKFNKRNYSTEPPKTNPKVENGHYTPAADKVKSFKPMAAVFLVTGAIYAGLDIYANYFLPSKIEVSPEIDGSTEAGWMLFNLALAEGKIGSSNPMLSAYQTLSKSGVVEKGVSQLTIAINRLVEIDREVKSGKNSLNRAELDQIFAVVDTIQNALASLTIFEANVKKMVDLGVMEHIVVLHKLVPDRYLVNMKLFYAIKQHSSVAGEVAKYEPQLPKLKQEEIDMLSVKKQFAGKLDMGEEATKVAVLGSAGAVYCGIVWKMMHRGIPGGRLLQKMTWAVIGCTLPYIIETSCSQFASSKFAIQKINENIEGKKDNELYSPTNLLAVELTNIFGGMIAFFVPWYFGKYLFFPANFGASLYAVISNYYNMNVPANPKNL